jgi:hypothetical protein
MPDLTRTLTSILKNGGQNWGYRRVTVDSSDVITASEVNWHNGVYRMSSKITNTTNEESVPGEDGEILTYEKGIQELIYLIKSAQFDKATIEFLQEYGSTPVYFQMIVSWGLGADNKAMEAFMPLVKFSGDFDVDLPGRKFDIKVQILSNKTSHTPSDFTGLSWVQGAAVDFTTAANKRFKINETT